MKTQIQDCCAHTENLALQTVSAIQVVRSFKAEEQEKRRYSEAVTQMQTLRRRQQLYSYLYGLMRRVRWWRGLISDPEPGGALQEELVQAPTSCFPAGGESGDKAAHAALRSPPHLLRQPHHRSSGLLLLVPETHLQEFKRELVFALLVFLSEPFVHQGRWRLFQEILYSFGDTMSTVRIISKVFGYLDRRPDCKEEGDLAPEELEGSILFQNVSFSYPSAPDKKALKVQI